MKFAYLSRKRLSEEVDRLRDSLLDIFREEECSEHTKDSIRDVLNVPICGHLKHDFNCGWCYSCVNESYDRESCQGF